MRSGIRFEINAVSHSFYVFPANRSESPSPHPRPPRKALQIGLWFSAFIRSAAPADKFRILEAGPNGTLSTTQSFHSAGTTSIFFKSPVLHNPLFTELPAEIKHLFLQYRSPFTPPLKSCVCGETFRLDASRKQQSVFSKTFRGWECVDSVTWRNPLESVKGRGRGVNFQSRIV